MNGVIISKCPDVVRIDVSTRQVLISLLALLLYDYVLTLGNEIDLFWRRAPVVARLVFFSLRLSILGSVITTILDSYVPQYDEFVGYTSLRQRDARTDNRYTIAEAVRNKYIGNTSLPHPSIPLAASQHIFHT